MIQKVQEDCGRTRIPCPLAARVLSSGHHVLPLGNRILRRGRNISDRANLIYPRWTSQMPKFYFHIRTPFELDLEEMGTECASVEEATLQAVRAAKEIIFEWISEGSSVDGEVLEIVDEQRVLVATVPFASIARQH